MNRKELENKTLPELKQMCRMQGLIFSPDDGRDDLITLLANTLPVDTQSSESSFSFGAENKTAGEQQVHVASGASASYFNVAGMSVQSIREKLQDALNIDSDAAAILNGDVVGAGTTVRAGDSLEFIKRAGKKGQEASGETVNSNVEETTMEFATPSVVVIDGKTMLCNLSGNVARDTFVVGNPMAITQDEFFDFIEMSLMGQLFTITVSQLAQISQRNLSDKEVQDWNIAVATYQRADALKDKYLLVNTVQRIR